MTPLAWFFLGLSVGWVVAGIAVAIMVGRTVHRRDRQRPNLLLKETPMPDLASERAQRYALLGDRFGELLDQAHISVTVRYRGTAEAPQFGLAHLAKVLDDAGLVDDTTIGEHAR